MSGAALSTMGCKDQKTFMNPFPKQPQGHIGHTPLPTTKSSLNWKQGVCVLCKPEHYLG